MRRVISFLLVLALCLSMACTAYATFTPSSGEGGTPSQKPTDNPKTGDIILMWAIIMLLALIALIAVIVISRKVFR